LLGTHAWRVTKVETSVVRVVDAHGASPTAPFWFGESPGRTIELSRAVATLHEELLELLSRGDHGAAREHVRRTAGANEAVAEQVVTFLAASYATLGTLPTNDNLVIERFFDETESAHLVLHSPRGARVNRALGLALRKRFCVTFDFELQAAADDDTVTIALGPHHSFALESVTSMVRSTVAREVLTQAVLPLPMLAARWRWNAARALVMRRSMNGQRRPIHLRRMEADDLMAATWPSLASCQGTRQRGRFRFPITSSCAKQFVTFSSEPLDADRLVELLSAVEAGSVTRALSRHG
jgi:ATP-dependent Lhr-like helicase